MVIGGTGAFGRRLISGLIATTDHDVVIAARDLSRAQALAGEMNAGTPVCRVTARRMDVRAVTADELKSSGVFLVVDCAGPFQAGDYRLARAAIAAERGAKTAYAVKGHSCDEDADDSAAPPVSKPGPAPTPQKPQ